MGCHCLLCWTEYYTINTSISSDPVLPSHQCPPVWQHYCPIIYLMWLTHSALFDIVNHLKLSHPLVSITPTWFFSLSIWSLSASWVTAPPLSGLCGCSPVFHFGYLLTLYTISGISHPVVLVSIPICWQFSIIIIIIIILDYYFQLLGITYWASLVAQMVKIPPAMWETWVRSLSWEDALKEGMAIHSSILAWRIPMNRGAW